MASMARWSAVKASVNSIPVTVMAVLAAAVSGAWVLLRMRLRRSMLSVLGVLGV